MSAPSFRALFEAIHRKPPFPWQERLAADVVEHGAWPDVLDLPTGSGKTACIDVALFHWLTAASAGTPWLAARRIVFVVDRRIVVDEAAERAKTIQRAIRDAKKGVLAEIRPLLLASERDARRELHEKSGTEGPKSDATEDDDPLDVFTLRGGVARERNLAREPLRVSVVLSTVDQIGSRLLFRGYGVSPGMLPIHAGLFGVDTLLLLDEAHIAAPFRQTLEGIVREQRRARLPPSGPRPLHWAQLTATPTARKESARVFSLDETDWKDPIVSLRLTAKKPMRLLAVDKRTELPKKLVELVKEELAKPRLVSHEQPRIGIVVNRVATARDTFEAMQQALKDAVEVELLIGRTRPIDRDDYAAKLMPKLRATGEARPGEKPIVVVATQTIEVGADFDFHAMFLEAASYAAIRQRLGRCNRLGKRGAARGAIILVRAGADDDPVYRNTIETTWSLLTSHAKEDEIDLGISSAPPATTSTEPPAEASPQLTPATLALLVQTSPYPAVQPNVAELLHGFQSQPADVQVVWRDGLENGEELVPREHASALLDALPPSSLEAMSLPFATFRAWAASWGESKAAKMPDLTDVEGEANAPEETHERLDARVFVVAHNKVSVVQARQVRPGALVVIPTSRGGADRLGFNPERREPVEELALRARDPSLRSADSGRRTRERKLVWTKEVGKGWFRASSEPRDVPLRELLEDLDVAREDASEVFAEWLAEVRNELPADVRRTGEELLEKRPVFEWLEAKGERIGIVLREGKAGPDDLVEGANLQRTVRVLLRNHLQSVGELASVYATGVGLSPSLIAALAAAGTAHDLGKADPRFQRRLRAGPDELLAKSDEYDRGVPRGERHEAYSVAILDAHPEVLANIEEHRALVRYLVGTHHGYGRASQPDAADHGIALSVEHGGKTLQFSGRPALHSVAAGWEETFVSLHRTYGAWMLAYLESILRLADHRRSEREIDEYHAAQAARRLEEAS